jgi:hypothetical protein
MIASAPTRACLAVLAAMAWCDASLAGLDEGLAALSRRDYAAAAKELRPLAERGNAEAQYPIGRMYEFGAGYPVDKAQGIAWFRKAATLGNPTAQYNLGLMIAKGAGVPQDAALAVDWFRKAAAQGMAGAQFKLGLAYEFGEGVARDPLLAYASFAFAARDGTQEHVTRRDDLAAKLTPAQAKQGLALAGAWSVGQPMPASATAVGAPSGPVAAASARTKDRCSATGRMDGQPFSATHCAVSRYGDQNSVAIWFNEEPIGADEVESFRVSSYADGSKGGKPRTMLQIMFCPGGGKPTASAAAVTSIDLNTSHAKAPLAGVQTVVEAPRDYKVDRMSGEIGPGRVLSGKIVGSRGKTSWNLDFELTLPDSDAAAGMSCGK